MTKPIWEARQADWDAVHKGRMQAAARNIIARARDAEDRVIRGEDVNASPDVEYEQAKETISAEKHKQFMDQNRADGFVGLVEHFLAMAPNYSQLQGLKGAERCQVVLQVDVNTLREQKSGVCCVHGRADYEQTPSLAPETARRLSCDALLVTVIESEDGLVLNVGRRSRVVPARIRRAMVRRE
ncbi:hypothetical protein [Halioglobus sp. HI00S01]|uniref:hypothetical protein n=1 Tax=Halioglobus sp. HI00S01 TaxID=1822214 RepID=UPI001E545A7B|nr:hypothetical protein [Halioglobus sp. HI00S01]